MNNDQKWTPQDVTAILLDPTHALRGVVPDEQWVAAQKRLLREFGREAYFQQLGLILDARFQFADSSMNVQDMISRLVEAYDRRGDDVFFHDLLQHCRTGKVRPESS